jgi:hypothetical protein
MPLPPDPAGTKKPRKGLRSQRAAGAKRASKRGTDGELACQAHGQIVLAGEDSLIWDVVL